MSRKGAKNVQISEITNAIYLVLTPNPARVKDRSIKMSNQGTGTVIPYANGGPRTVGGMGHVNVNGTVVQGTNIGNGQVRTPDGKIHNSK